MSGKDRHEKIEIVRSVNDEASDFICYQSSIISCCNKTLDLVIEKLEEKDGLEDIASILHLLNINLSNVNRDLSIFELKSL